jgi:hypothetical protein
MLLDLLDETAVLVSATHDGAADTSANPGEVESGSQRRTVVRRQRICAKRCGAIGSLQRQVIHWQRDELPSVLAAQLRARLTGRDSDMVRLQWSIFAGCLGRRGLTPVKARGAAAL